MRVFSVVLLFIAFKLSAEEKGGVVVSILPDTLLLNSSCKAMADLAAKDFSILYACRDSLQRMYFYNFRLNDIDLIADFKKTSTGVVVNKSQFKVYTLYELTAKNSDDKPIKFVSYCTNTLCLDLVSDNEYEKSIQDSITSQLGG